MLEPRQAISEGRVFRARPGPVRRAVDGGQDLDAVLCRLTDDVVVMAPVIGGIGTGLHGAPGEVHPERPDLAAAHPSELGGAGQRLRGDHAVEAARRAWGFMVAAGPPAAIQERYREHGGDRWEAPSQ